MLKVEKIASKTTLAFTFDENELYTLIMNVISKRNDYVGTIINKINDITVVNKEVCIEVEFICPI